jgi:hypothetical protein
VLTSDFGIGYFVENPGTYTMTADVFLGEDMAAPGASWQIGFNNNTNSSAGANRSLLSADSFGGAPALSLNGNGVLIAKVAPGTTVLTTPADTYPAGTEYTLKLVLDTIPEFWTVAAYVDDVQLDLNSGDANSLVYTYGTNPTIRFATIASTINNGLSSDASNVGDMSITYLDNFELTVVPEPSMALLVPGLFALAARRARRR